MKSKLLYACRVIEAVPEDQFGLDQIITIEGDTLVGDAAYWLAQDPTFKHYGLSIERGCAVCIDGEYLGYRRAMAQLFDLSLKTAHALFGARCESSDLSDKALFLRRVREYVSTNKTKH